MIRMTKVHSEICCNERENFYLQRDLERTMKKEVKKPHKGGSRKVFNECTREAPEIARNNVTWEKMYSVLYKHRRKNQPKRPKNVGQLVQGFIDFPTTYGKNFLDSFEVDGELAGVLLGDPELINAMRRAKDGANDATFGIMPRGYYQLLTIMIFLFGKAWPAILIWMKSKSRKHYDAAFLKVHELVPEFKPENFMADFEVAPRKSLMAIYDGNILLKNFLNL